MKRLVLIAVISIFTLNIASAVVYGNRAYHEALAKKVIPSGNKKRVIKQPAELIIIAQNYVDSVAILKSNIDKTDNTMEILSAIDALAHFRARNYLDIQDLHGMYKNMSLEEDSQKKYENLAKQIGWEINPNYVYTPVAKKAANKGRGNLTGKDVYYHDSSWRK